MLKECKKAGTTAAGNYKQPSYADCLQWVTRSWGKLNTAGVVKKSKQLGMSAELGPEIDGYVDQHFQDLEPAGEVAEVPDPSFARDLPSEE